MVLGCDLNTNELKGSYDVERLFPPPNESPFWAHFTTYRALDIQAANGTSPSSKLDTGGPVYPVMSSGMSDVAQSVSSPRLLVTSP